MCRPFQSSERQATGREQLCQSGQQDLVDCAVGRNQNRVRSDQTNNWDDPQGELDRVNGRQEADNFHRAWLDAHLLMCLAAMRSPPRLCPLGRHVHRGRPGARRESAWSWAAWSERPAHRRHREQRNENCCSPCAVRRGHVFDQARVRVAMIHPPILRPARVDQVTCRA